jgi:hypothetical protein
VCSHVYTGTRRATSEVMRCQALPHGFKTVFGIEDPRGIDVIHHHGRASLHCCSQ